LGGIRCCPKRFRKTGALASSLRWIFLGERRLLSKIEMLAGERQRQLVPHERLRRLERMIQPLG